MVTARVLDGKAMAAEIRADVARRVTRFAARHGRHPCFATIIVGGDPSTVAYARAKARAAERVGLGFRSFQLPEEASSDDVIAQIEELNASEECDAILLELPLPPSCDTQAVQAHIDPARDVDGVTPHSITRLFAGRSGPRPATAVAVMAILDMAAVRLEGARATVVGRSTGVGKPVALLLLDAHATVTTAHTRTADLPEVTKEAHVLICAAGSPGLIGREHVRPGAVVIDVGTSPVQEGDRVRLAGDVRFDEVCAVAGAVTPVPGGVGPVTTAVVLRSAVQLAEARAR